MDVRPQGPAVGAGRPLARARAAAGRGLRVLRHVVRHFAVVATLALYGLLAPWGYALFAVMVISPTGDPVSRRDRLQAAIRTGFRALHAWLRLADLADVRPPPPAALSLPHPCVLIANHPTHLDITAILSWSPRTCTIVKPAIFRQWWLEPLLSGSGQIRGADPQPLEAARLVDRAVERIRDGLSVVVFPEGTRTVQGAEMPFHRLAFEIACRADVPVVPLRITCEPAYLSKERPVLRPPPVRPVLSLQVLEPVWPREFEGNSRRLRDRLRSHYACRAAQG